VRLRLAKSQPAPSPGVSPWGRRLPRLPSSLAHQSELAVRGRCLGRQPRCQVGDQLRRSAAGCSVPGALAQGVQLPGAQAQVFSCQVLRRGCSAAGCSAAGAQAQVRQTSDIRLLLVFDLGGVDGRDVGTTVSSSALSTPRHSAAEAFVHASMWPWSLARQRSGAQIFSLFLLPVYIYLTS